MNITAGEARRFLAMIKEYCPWLGTEDSVSGSDAVDQINELHDKLQEIGEYE